MTVHEVAKRVMKDKGYSQAEVAERAGMKGQSAVAMWLSGKSMRVDSLVKILDACGYDLIVKDRGGRCDTYRISNEPGSDVIVDTQCVMRDDMLWEVEDKIRRIVRDEMQKAGERRE